MSSTSEKPRLAATLTDLYARTAAGIKLDLEPIRAVLSTLGEPHQGYRHVLIAGTNGKGSTARTLAEALGHAGHRVGLYTSPHLLRFSERIRIAGQEIDAEAVLALHGRICAAERGLGRPLTFFEATTAMALVAFAEAAVDVAVLEVGLGGRLDATNVVTPQAAVITPIGRDHMSWLGDTLDLIAAEKGAILPAGGIGIMAPQPAEVRAVLSQMARERGGTLIEATHQRSGDGLLLTSGDERIIVPDPPAPFFADSLAAAWGAYRLAPLGLPTPPDAFLRALGTVIHRGRFEWHGPDLLLDAAHNPHALSALTAALAADPRVGRRTRHVVFGCLADKELTEMLPLATALGDAIYLTTLPVRRGASARELAPLCPGARCFEHPAEALRAAQTAAAGDGGLVVVTGSIFLVSEALGVLTDEPRDPPVAG